MAVLNRKTNLRPMLGTIFVIFSGFYLSSIPWNIPIITNPSPIYFVALFGSYFYIISRLKSPYRIKLNNLMILAIVAFFYFSIFQMFIGGDLNMTANICLWFIFFFVVYERLSRAKLKSILRISENFVIFSIIILSIEALLRIINSGNLIKHFISFILGSGTEFYQLKRNSIMFADSNSTAFYASTVLLFVSYLSDRTNKVYFIEKLILIILILLSFSRASLIALITIYLIKLIFSNLRKLWLLYLLPILLGVSIFVFSPILQYILSDPSFRIKMNILQNTADYVGSANIRELLFGIGFGGGLRILGIWLHNFLVTFFVESGIIGISIILAFLIAIIKKTKGKDGYLILFLLIAGFSFFPYAIAYFFVVLALMCIIEKENQRIKIVK